MQQKANRTEGREGLYDVLAAPTAIPHGLYPEEGPIILSRPSLLQVSISCFLLRLLLHFLEGGQDNPRAPAMVAEL